MNILMLTPYLPYPLVSGGQIRTFNLLKHLSKKHRITLFALIKEESDKQYISYLEPYCANIQLFKRSTKPFTFHNILKAALSLYPFVVTRNLVPNTLKAVEAELTKQAYDVIHAETFYMMPNIPPTSIPTILVEQTIEYLGYQSYARGSRWWFLKPFFAIDIAKIKYWEQYFWNHCDHLITMSHEDKALIAAESPTVPNITVVANGVDLDHFKATVKQLPDNPTVLFVGTFSWLPNRQAVTYLVEKVWPIIAQQMPEAKLHIVGFQPTPAIKRYAADPAIRVDGSVEDIRTAYAGAHVLVAPVMWGKGTRYKILEAMATNTPIVATHLAVEGIAGIKHGIHAMLSDDASGLANNTIKVLKDSKLQRSLASHSFQLVQQAYNWPAIAADLDHVYESLGKNRS